MALTTQEKIELRNRVFAEYGVSDANELKRHPEFQAALQANAGNEAAALDALMVRKVQVSPVGFFIRHDQYTEYNQTAGERVVKDEGPCLLLPDGNLQTFWVGKDLREEGASTLTTVQVGPLTQVRNLRKGTVSKPRAGEQTQAAIVKATDVSIPIVPIGDAIKDLLKRNKFGTIYGKTASWSRPVMTLQIGGEEEIYFQPPEEDKNGYLSVTCYPVHEDDFNPDGSPKHTIRVEISVEEACRAFNLDVTDDPDTWKSELQKERILVFGETRVVDRKTRAHFEKDDEKAMEDGKEVRHVQEFDTLIQQDVEPYLEGYKDIPLGGGKLRRLNLTKASEGEGVDLSNGITCGNYRVVDVIEERPGEFALHISAFLNKQGQWVNVTPTLSTIDVEREVKQGPNAGSTFRPNEGAFCIFLDHLDQQLGEGSGQMSLETEDLDFVLGGSTPAQPAQQQPLAQQQETAPATPQAPEQPVQQPSAPAPAPVPTQQVPQPAPESAPVQPEQVPQQQAPVEAQPAQPATPPTATEQAPAQTPPPPAPQQPGSLLTRTDSPVPPGMAPPPTTQQ